MFLLVLFFAFSTGQCTSDADCSAGTPVCSLATGTCVQCLSDVHCRNGNQCNGVCDNFKCSSPVEQPYTVCAWNEVCYEGLGKCFAKCNLNADCAGIPQVLHFPNTGVCQASNGKCYDCLTTADCKPYKNETCNSECTYNPKTLEYLCANGNFCDYAKDKTSCKIQPTTPTSYKCSNGNVMYVSFLLLLVAIAFSL